jgi:large conductance mechanosensitive channel
MSFLQEFKQFAMRGNVVDLAIGVVIGGAFGKIVSSLVADIFMPVLGLITGGVNFSNMAVTLKDAATDHPAVLLSYGKFVQATIDFIIIAFAVFLFMKAMNSMRRSQAAEPPPAPPAPTPSEQLLTEIRDLLKAK